MIRRLSMSHLDTLAKVLQAIEELEKITPCRAIIFKASHVHSDYFEGTDGYFYHYISMVNQYLMGAKPYTQAPYFMLGDDEYSQFRLLKQTGASYEAQYLYFLQYGVDNQCLIQQ